jgi:hypothetical protein
LFEENYSVEEFVKMSSVNLDNDLLIKPTNNTLGNLIFVSNEMLEWNDYLDVVVSRHIHFIHFTEIADETA